MALVTPYAGLEDGFQRGGLEDPLLAQTNQIGGVRVVRLFEGRSVSSDIRARCADITETSASSAIIVPCSSASLP